jgi:di/tricarboxylate transporter
MTVNPKLEAIAMKVMEKMDLSHVKKDKYGSIVVVLMIIGIVISLMRLIQACNAQKLGLLKNKKQKAKLMHEEVKALCITRSLVNKWRLKKLIKEKLSAEDYKLYGTQLRDAILDTGVDLTEEDSIALMEAANA